MRSGIAKRGIPAPIDKVQVAEHYEYFPANAGCTPIFPVNSRLLQFFPVFGVTNSRFGAYRGRLR
jgi:hypothetical protein